MSATIDLHLGEPPENFEPGCTDPRWVLTVTCGDQMNVTTFSKRLAEAFPGIVQYLSDKAVRMMRGEHENVRLGAELAQFKQWASDACELLHELLPRHTAVRRTSDQQILDLLRRMENP